MAVQDPKSLFTYDLSTIYCAEQTIQQMMPQLEQECQHPQVKQLFGDVANKMQQHVTRLQECFRLLGEQPMNVSCHVAEGFRQEHQQFMQQGPASDVIDLHCMALGIKIGHYKIGFYTTLVAGARELGYHQCQSILEDTLRDLESTVRQTEQLGSRITAQTIQRTSP